MNYIMNYITLFQSWAPEDSLWSPWVKPVAFRGIGQQFNALQLPPINYTQADVAWVPPPSDTALILDLRGVDAVLLGLQLARRGYRPVPLFNAASDSTIQAVPMSPIQRELKRGAQFLQDCNLPGDAPPVFLLDAYRMRAVTVAEGTLDNRWMTFPQDFPSANLLLAHGITAVTLWYEHAPVPGADLAHVLLRWQEAGIRLSAMGPDRQLIPLPVYPPRRYRAWWYLLLATLGLRRNSAGGFGGIVPEINTGGGGFHG